MLVIPMTNRINWENPPVVTIALILASFLVFFLFQRNDDRYYREAGQYYSDSGLAKIELPRYLAYLGQQNRTPYPGIETLDEHQAAEYHFRMESDFDFLTKLMSGEIILPTDSEYGEWKISRQEYERLRARAVFYTYGFKPAYFEPLTLFTAMFLHGGAGHLIGNMIFLWLAGCILEAGCGRVRFFLAYLLTGVCAGLLFKLVYFHSTVPLIGASGAISGLMGAFTVLFGTKKLKVFLTLGFFFNYLSIRGFYLFILWVGNEVVQLSLGEFSNVAYVAHIGGLLSGGVLALILQKIPNAVDQTIFQGTPEDLISPMVEQALRKMARLDLEGAETVLLKALEKDPDNYQVLAQLFKIYKQAPEQKQFHRVSEKILAHLIRTGSHVRAHEFFNEYHRSAGTLRLPPQLLVRFSLSLCALDCPDKAGKLLVRLAKKDKTIPGLPAALFKVSFRFKQMGDSEKQMKYQNFICRKFPYSDEADLLSKAAKTV